MAEIVFVYTDIYIKWSFFHMILFFLHELLPKQIHCSLQRNKHRELTEFIFYMFIVVEKTRIIRNLSIVD